MDVPGEAGWFGVVEVRTFHEDVVGVGSGVLAPVDGDVVVEGFLVPAAAAEETTTGRTATSLLALASTSFCRRGLVTASASRVDEDAARAQAENQGHGADGREDVAGVVLAFWNGGEIS